jgi:hypothetical protein
MTTMNKTEKILFVVSLFFTAGIFSVTILNRKIKQTQPIEMVLLKAEADSVNRIEIKKGSAPASIIQREGDLWFCLSDDATVRACANKIMIYNLISEFKKNRKLYTISYSNNSWESLDLTEKQSSVITMYGNNFNMCTKLYIGKQIPLTNGIAIRSDKNIKSFETTDDFSVFLSKDINFWLDPFILAGLDVSPENSITVLAWNDTTSLNHHLHEGDLNFPAAAQLLPELRHGAFRDENILFHDFFSELTIETGNGRILKISFYPEKNTADPDITTYLAKSSFIPSPVDSGSTKKVLLELHPCFEISEWTFDKIKNLFN